MDLNRENFLKDNILVVENLRQYFKVGSGKRKVIVKAVHNISFTIKKGEVFGMVGESGCGKTTSGRSIIGLYQITDGQIFFKGERIAMGTKQIVREIRRLNEEKAEITKEYSRQCALLSKDRTTVDDEYKHARQLMIDDYNNQKTLLTNEYKNKISDLDDDILGLKGERTKVEVNAQEDETLREKISSFENDKEELIKNQRLTLENLSEKHHNDLETLNLKHSADIELLGNKADHTATDLKTAYSEKINAIKTEIKNIKSSNKRNQDLMSKMQMIFQDPIASLNPRMTVREIIAEGLIIRGERDQEKMLQEVYRVLKLVGLVPEHAGRYPHEFSGGQRQRIGIARALIVNPELIIADEPISALDVSIQAQVINLLNDLRHELGLTIMFIAHDLSVVKMFCDRIGVMYYGRMVEMASTEELFKNPLHPYTRALLSAIPLPDPIPEKLRKREVYNPNLRKRTKEKPQMLEIKKDHFIYCSPEELDDLRKLLKD